MKKLICAGDVEAAQSEGKKVIYIDKKTIITPSAKDIALAYGIEFSIETPVYQSSTTCKTSTNEATKTYSEGLDSEMIYKLLNAMMDKGLLNGVLDSIINPKPYIAESASNGLKVIRGNSVKLDAFNTGNPNSKVYCQEIISKDESSMSAGLLTIDHSKFDREIVYEEINYVIEGTLTVTIDGKTLTANSGDIIYIPSGSKVTWGSSDKAKVLYVTYPSRNLPKKDFVLG